jgi:hypothetical protein
LFVEKMVDPAVVSAGISEKDPSLGSTPLSSDRPEDVAAEGEVTVPVSSHDSSMLGDEKGVNDSTKATGAQVDSDGREDLSLGKEFYNEATAPGKASEYGPREGDIIEDAKNAIEEDSSWPQKQCPPFHQAQAAISESKTSTKPESKSPPPLSAGRQGSKTSDGGTVDEGKRESFTAETPYFGAYVDRELRHLTILSETLYDISARARAAGQSGAAMADANRKLSLACKLFPTYDRNGDDWISAAPGDGEGKSRERRICEARTEAVGKEMGRVLRILGEVGLELWAV